MGTFRQALGVGSWAALLPFALASLVKIPLILATESVFSVNIGLAALLPDGDPSSVLYQALMTYGDLFTWWGLFALVVGFQQVFEMPQRSAIVTVVLPWALLSAIPLAITMMIM